MILAHFPNKHIPNKDVFLKKATNKSKNIVPVLRVQFDTALNNFIVDQNTGIVSWFSINFNWINNFWWLEHSTIYQIYVGCENRLHQLTADLDTIASVQTGPVNISMNSSSNARTLKLSSNINRVLLVNYNSNQLITCSSILGQYSTRDLQNISFPEQNIVYGIVSREYPIFWITHRIFFNSIDQFLVNQFDLLKMWFLNLIFLHKYINFLYNKYILINNKFNWSFFLFSL